MALRIVEFIDQRERSPFAAWFEGLSAEAAAKVTAALYQVGEGNWGNTKGVGGGVFERKVDSVILLGGSTKQRQQQAIEAARERWREYRRRKLLRKE
jgi:putative component of toxin-antitoxin plasmid stabilization module